MAAVNQDQLIGSLIPDVYIKTITLETSGTPIRETNPHIEHARESIKVKKSPTDNLLIAKIDLLLKEQLDSGLVDTWFSNQDFQKYLRFTVIQSTDPLATKILSSSNNAIQIANINSDNEAAVYLAELMGELKEMPEFASIGGMAPAYSEDDIPELIELITSNTQVKYVSVAEHLLNNKSLLTQQYESTSSTGARIFDFTFRVKFEVPTKTPSHLSYFAVSTLDIDQLIEDFNLDAADTHLFELMNGKVAADVIIKNSNLVSKSFVFKDADGNIWTGPVHESDGAWLTGAAASENKSPVTRHQVENNKIQDFRDFDSVERLQLDFSVVQNSLFNESLPYKRLTNDSMDVSRTENYFSEVALARDAGGNCRLAFAIDYGKMIRDHTQYGALYSKSNLNHLLGNVKIRSFTLKRRRVKRNFTTLNKLGSPTERRDIFDTDAPDEVISYAGESRPGQFVSNRSKRGIIRELEIELESEFGELRHFMGIDRTMWKTTDGHYQYGIEIEVEDNTKKLIRSKIYSLAKAKYWLDYYYNTATLPNHFDPVSNRFTQEFIDKQYSQYEGSSGQNSFLSSPWIRPLITYLSVLSFFSKNEIDEKFAAALWKYTDPKSGTPRGIAMIQKLVENLMQRLSSAVGINLVERRARGLRADSSGDFVQPTSVMVPGKPSVKTFKIEYFFPQTFDSNLPKQMGYDYLSNGNLEREENIDGLRTISGPHYIKRAELETLKYYNSASPDIDMAVGSVMYTKGDSINNTRLTYLSPSNVNIGRGGNISLLGNAIDAETCLRIQSTVANINLAKKSPFMPMAKPPVTKNANKASHLSPNSFQVKDNFTNIMSNFNCTLIAPISSPFHNVAQLLEMDFDPYTDVGDILGEEWMSVDPIQAEALASNETDEAETNKNPIPLFSALAYPMITFGVGMGGITTSGTSTLINTPAKEEVSTSKASFDMNYFNLTNLQGALSKWAKLLSVGNMNIQESSEQDAGETSHINPGLSTAITNLPNQIKCLFLMNTSQPPVRNNWAGSSAPLLQMPGGKAAFMLNFKTLRKTEVMIGYEVDANGAPLLKRPIWAPLTYDLLESGGGDNLLCRTVKYENKIFGAQEAVGLRLPVYNKYFIISNPGRGASLLRRGRALYKDRIAKRVNRILRQHRYLSGEYLSTTMVSSRRIIPRRETRRRVYKNTSLARKLKPTRKF